MRLCPSLMYGIVTCDLSAAEEARQETDCRVQKTGSVIGMQRREAPGGHGSAA
ncbi:hypothetical protein [Paenibacillus elgii]|uniref:hypothetical protein n=1 Tax=Paenibacillus elgii TaxID=189691 RepID=UPI00203F9E48|nr:hypothetical protein [Paenibacillus elgii]MCM3267167.1 hypothetical protein [Paenibacillus elgii]